ncbi:oligosaccharide flippase family protein [Chloroflexota bacterium]
MNSSPPEFTINRRTIITNIATLFSGSAIVQALTAVILLLTARQLGPEQYGQYASSLALATALSIVFSLGLNLWLLRAGGREPSRIGALLGSVFGLKLSIGIVWFSLIFFLAPMINSSSLPTNLVRLAAFTILIGNLFVTVLTSFKAILRNRINASIEVVSICGQLFVTFLLINAGNQNAFDYLGARSLILLISLPVALIVAQVILHLRPNLNTAKQALAQSPPYAISEFLAWMFMRADLLIVAMKLGDYSAGIYSAASGVLNALFIVPNTVGFVIVPVLSNLFASHVEQAWLTAKRALGLLLIIGIGLFVAIFFGAELLVLILGQSYSESQEILQLLSIIILFQSINYGTAAILVATNQQAKRTAVQFIAVSINVILNLLVIDRLGLIGVAYVYIITEIVLMIGYAFLVVRYRRKTYSQSGSKQEDSSE